MPLPRVEQLVHDHLIALDKDKDRRSPEGLRVRASSAGRCARAIGFQICGLEQTNPPTPDSLVNFWIGDRVHDLVQQAILKQWPGAEIETKGTIGGWLWGHSDVLYRAEDGELVVLEIKSTADFGFEKATGVALKSNGRWKKKEPDPPEGPKKEHLLQAGIYAVMHGARYIAIVYVRKTAAKDEPVTWEWRFLAAQLKEDVEAEIQRLRDILARIEVNLMPDREFNGEVIDPKAKKFPCTYCSYRDACIQLGTGEVEIK